MRTITLFDTLPLRGVGGVFFKKPEGVFRYQKRYALTMKNQFIPYRKDLRSKARELRNNSTFSEILLWNEIKNRQINGIQFHRQVPILDFIVDFYSHEWKLAIEIDGYSHNDNRQ